MSFLGWVRKRKLISRIVMIISILYAMKTGLDKIEKEESTYKKDPVVRVITENTKYLLGVFDKANNAVTSNDIEDIREAIDILHQADDKLNGALFREDNLDELANKGLISEDQRNIARTFRQQILNVRNELSYQEEQLKK